MRICNLLHVYVLWPISLAIEFQLERLKGSITTGPIDQAERDVIVTSLHNLEAALRKLKSRTTHFDDLLVDLKASIESHLGHDGQLASSDSLNDTDF